MVGPPTPPQLASYRQCPTNSTNSTCSVNQSSALNLITPAQTLVDCVPCGQPTAFASSKLRPRRQATRGAGHVGAGQVVADLGPEPEPVIAPVL